MAFQQGGGKASRTRGARDGEPVGSVICVHSDRERVETLADELKAKTMGGRLSLEPSEMGLRFQPEEDE